MVDVATVSAAELTCLARNAPMMVLNNPIRDFLSAPVWRTTATTAGADVTDTNNGPTRFLYEGRGSPRSKPLVQSPAVNTYYLHFELRQGADAKHTIDTFAALNHNFDTLAAGIANTINFTVVVADDGNYSTGFRQIARWTNYSSKARLVQRSLGAAPSNERYTNVRYLRIQIDSAANFTTGLVPEIGEVVLGRRRQMPWGPTIGEYDDVELETLAADNEFPTGDIYTVVHAERRAVFNLRFQPHGLDVGSGLNWDDELRAWFREGGDKDTFLYFDKPNTAPTQAHWVKLSREHRLYMPYQGPFDRDVRFTLVEQAPLYDPEIYP